jgi:hypothetical protein
MDIQNVVLRCDISIFSVRSLNLLGIGLSTFGGLLATIYHFKPQTVPVSTVFLAVISYVLGEGMAVIIPRKTFIGKFFNPHPVSMVCYVKVPVNKF